MLRGVFEISETVVREVMTPRTEMVAVPVEVTLARLLEVATVEGHSRIPVFEGTIDSVLGVVLTKDLLRVLHERGGVADGPFDVRTILRPAYFVPDTKPVDELLSELRRQAVHMAIVLDEFGGTYGMVTLEDLLEEIVGEINDEFDEVEPDFAPTPEGDMLIDAGVLISRLQRALRAADSGGGVRHHRRLRLRHAGAGAGGGGLGAGDGLRGGDGAARGVDGRAPRKPAAPYPSRHGPVRFRGVAARGGRGGFTQRRGDAETRRRGDAERKARDHSPSFLLRVSASLRETHSFADPVSVHRGGQLLDEHHVVLVEHEVSVTRCRLGAARGGHGDEALERGQVVRQAAAGGAVHVAFHHAAAGEVKAVRPAGACCPPGGRAGAVGRGARVGVARAIIGSLRDEEVRMGSGTAQGKRRDHRADPPQPLRGNDLAALAYLPGREGL